MTPISSVSPQNLCRFDPIYHEHRDSMSLSKQRQNLVLSGARCYTVVKCVLLYKAQQVKEGCKMPKQNERSIRRRRPGRTAEERLASAGMAERSRIVVPSCTRTRVIRIVLIGRGAFLVCTLMGLCFPSLVCLTRSSNIKQANSTFLAR